MLLPHNSTIVVLDGAGMRLFRNRERDTHPELEQISSATFDHEVHLPHEKREAAVAHRAIAELRLKVGAESPLVIVAPSRVLGAVRHQMSIYERGRIVAEVRKELRSSSPDDIAQRLHELRQ